MDDLSKLSDRFRAELASLAAEPVNKGKIPGDVMKSVILALCRDQYVTVRCLASLVNRQPETLRGQYLSTMWRNRELKLAFPDSPNDSRQAYTSTP